jgi:ABC-type sugar transport system substrate-binding protein
MKRFIPILLASLMVLSLAACTAPTTGGSLPNIGVTIYKFDDTFMTSVRNTIADVAKDKAAVDIDFERLKQIRDAVPNTPLVLHGGSGVSAELLRSAIAAGIRKVNFVTELKNAFTQSVKASLSLSDDIDLRRTFLPAISAVEEMSKSKIRICSYLTDERLASSS